MKKLLPYIVFGIVYLLLCFAVEVIADAASSEIASQLVYYVAIIVAAPIALIAARRMAQLSVVGVLVTATLSELLAYATTVGLLSTLATKADPSFSVAAGIVSFARIGGWALALNTVAYILAPAVWLLVLNGRSSGLAPQTTA
ncbi:MAG: hypothetical protein ACREPQ_08910 [Rhodanobacter sp.]